MKQVHHRIFGLCAFVTSLCGLGACSSDSDDDNDDGHVIAGSAGAPKSTGGAKSTGGSGGASNGTAGAPATVITGKAVGKFCNQLAGAGNAPITLTLTVGVGADSVKLSASSGQCAPPKPTPCTNIPAGTAIPLTLSLDDEVVAEAVADLIGNGEETIFLAGLDEETNAPIVQGGKLKAGLKCNEVELQVAAGGAGGVGGTSGAAGAGGSTAGAPGAGGAAGASSAGAPSGGAG